MSLLVVWLGLLYGWTCGFGFINDDFGWIAEARSLISSGWRSPPSSGAFLRPIIHLSFLFNYLINGTAPFGYHLLNLGVAALNTYLVWRLARWILQAPVESVLVALLFAAHSAHPGAVTGDCGRTELIADAFYLGALLLHIRGRTAGAAALFALALLSKEGTVTFPLMALVVDRLEPRTPRWRWGSVAVYGCVLAAYLALRAGLSRTYSTYVGLEVVLHGPVSESVRWMSGQVGVMAQSLLDMARVGPTAAVSVLVLLIVPLSLAARDARARRAVRLGSVWMAVTILPFLGVPLLVPRYAYLPSVGLALVLVGGGRELLARRPGRRWVRVALAGCVAGWLTVSVWRTETRNEQLRRNSVLTQRVLDALARAVPQPASQTVFVVDGLGSLRLGRDPWARTPVLLFCLTDAVRLRFDDPTLDAVFPDDRLPPTAARTVVRVRWDDATGRVAILR